MRVNREITLKNPARYTGVDRLFRPSSPHHPHLTRDRSIFTNLPHKQAVLLTRDVQKTYQPEQTLDACNGPPTASSANIVYDIACSVVRHTPSPLHHYVIHEWPAIPTARC